MSSRERRPESQEAVVERLLEMYEELPAKLQVAARYIIDHPHEVGISTMRNLAAEARIHPNSFVRLARQLGFSGHEEMRERFRDFVRSGSGSSTDRVMRLQNLERKGGTSRIVAGIAESIFNNHEQTVDSLDVRTLERAAKWMLESDRVYVLGLGAGYPLAYNFWYVARMIREHFILIPRHGSLPMDDMLHARRDDLLFCMTFQPYRTDVINTMRFVRDLGVRVIGLSDSPTATICREADLGLFAPTHTPHFFHSNCAVIGLLEILCAILVAKGGEEAARHVDEFNTLRWETGIYEEQPEQ
ncbi:MAG: MurR/RpiR family transcriptional regulator [Gammaproteobacteria bacterium]|nr:MurR/RpiR family transcriptional regulator [Gammaproteobacteria bacterium]MYJ51768.1 MurR/RpiR family transcriptional regulator [Gammaproteobacteria bacterium]